MKKPIELLDFANEGHAWRELTIQVGDRLTWLYYSRLGKEILRSPEIMAMGFDWYKHPAFEGYEYGRGLDRIRSACDGLFATLGYEHEDFRGRYKAVKPTDERVALFAHEGFGVAFLSAVMDIPYPIVASHFLMRTTGVTAISFQEGADGYAIPRIRSFNSEAHLLADGLPQEV